MRGDTSVRFALGAVLLLAACGGDGDPASSTGGDDREPVVDGTFRTSITGDPGNLDPQLTVLALTRWVTTFMYDSLIFLDEGEAVPYLAESWEVDLTSVTYTLREGVTCSDGTPLTATDVADNFAFVADPANQSPQLGLWVPPGLTASADDASRTVTLTAAQPDPFLLQSTGLMQVVCRAGLDDRSQLESGSVGTGMFTLTESVAGDHYTFERRDEYAWGPEGAAASDQGTPKTVTLQVVANESTAANLFLAGDLDAVSLTGADIDRVGQSGADSIEVRALAGELVFNQQAQRPGADPQVRAALAQAADVAELATVLSGGHGLPAEGLGTLEPKVCTADTVSGNLPEHDLSAAASALDDAGWVEGEDGLRSKDGQPLAMTLLYPSEAGPGFPSTGELLAQQWAEIGVDVTLQPFTNTQVNEILFGTGAWDATLILVTVAFPSQLVPFFTGPVPPDGTNFGHLGNEEYSALVADAAQQPVDEGCALWEDAERALLAGTDVVPLGDRIVPLFLDGVEVRLLGANPAPPTLRMYQ